MSNSYFLTDDDIDELDTEQLTSVTLPLGAKSLGTTLGHLALHGIGVRLVQLRRHQGHVATLTDDTLLEEGDTLVLSGKPEALAIASDKVLKG